MPENFHPERCQSVTFYSTCGHDRHDHVVDGHCLCCECHRYDGSTDWWTCSICRRPEFAVARHNHPCE